MPLATNPPTAAGSCQRMPDLDALIQAFDAFIYICSQDHRIQYMNHKLQERTGYDATDEYCYKTWTSPTAILPRKNSPCFRP